MVRKKEREIGTADGGCRDLIHLKRARPRLVHYSLLPAAVTVMYGSNKRE